MKKFTIFEYSVIGLLVGVVISAYLTFLNATDGFIGKILSWVSLLPILNILKFSADNFLLVSFLLVVGVYTFYGMIVGIIINKRENTSIVIVALVILLPISIFSEQWIGMTSHQVSQETNISISNQTAKHTSKSPEQYFGTETFGDLNDDTKDDVAFLIPRVDDSKGTVYYLAVAIKSREGHTGTNLLFLGSKVLPKKLSIESGLVIVDYINNSDKTATTTKKMYAKVIDGLLKQITPPPSLSITTTTTSN